MSTHYEPDKKPDLTKPNPRVGWFGIIGVYPWRSCTECDHAYFNPGDWNMGYSCAKCGVIFGTNDEWAWLNKR